jgi:hypothetical protein
VRRFDDSYCSQGFVLLTAIQLTGAGAAQVAAITARRQEGRRCEPGRLAARQAHMPTRAAQALTGRMRRPWRWWLRGAGYVLLVAAISYGLLWLVLVYVAHPGG